LTGQCFFGWIGGLLTSSAQYLANIVVLNQWDCSRNT